MRDTEHLKKLEKMADKRLMELVERLESKEVPFNESATGYADILAHLLKSLSCVIAMREDEGSGESYRGGMSGARTVNTTDGARSYRGSYDDEMSGARGRGRGARRDSMGRYSGDGYSEAADELIEHLEMAKDCADDDSMRRKIQSMIREMK